MKPEDQNRAIAEAMGMKYYKPTPEELASGVYAQYEPNFCGDLNQMHYAEEILQANLKFWPDYVCELRNVMKRELMGDEFAQMMSDDAATYRCIHSTAAQRAEAFLRTLDLWLEEPTK